ncbi:hypothetical protein OC846_001718 [Tilletia horrida]|uniref:Ankyrin n=1 Tax=Tilletia horrida TaxID=155126 RepID=A0AAN6JVP1_9BASI|nr:hypothetical protein OC845_006779 [Tilletia horrida]KAK0555458.1 hypothetical protein OC846_001718 [Tilletia horrida]
MPVPTSTLITAPSEDMEGSTSSLTPAHINSNIWVAAGEGDLDSVRHLLEHQAHLTPTTPDDFSYTPLHAAASYAQLDMLRFLLTHPKAASYQPPESDVPGVPALTGGAVNVQDSDGDTPLFVCEAVEPARVLIEEFGADPRHVNLEGKTAARAAYENEAYEVAEYLRSITGEPEPELEDDDDDDDDDLEFEQGEDEDESGEDEDEEEPEEGGEEKAGDAKEAKDAPATEASNPAAPT